MKTLNGNLQKGAAVLVTAVALLLTAGIALAALFATQRNPEDFSFTLNPLVMVAGTAAWLAVFAAARLLSRRFGAFLLRFERPIAYGLTTLLTLGCLLAGWLLEVGRYGDVEMVFDAACSLAAGTGVPEARAYYFYIFPNNIGVTVILAAWLRATEWLGVPASAACLVLNAAMICLSAVFLRLLIRRLRGPAASLACLAALMCCLPLYAYAAVYYSDTIALPFGIGAAYLYCRADETGGRKRLLFWAGCGLALGVGMAVKMTVAVLAVALVLHALLRHGLRGAAQFLLSGGLAVALCLCANAAVTAHLLPDEQIQKTKLPYEHWVMMGLAGDGRWNADDERYSVSFGDTSEAARADREEIAARVREYGAAGMLRLWGRKTAYSFCDGTFNVSSMLDDSPVRRGFLHGIVLYTSPHFLLFFTFCTSHYISILLLAAANALRDLLAKRAAVNMAFALRLALFGFWLFLMLWESNSRYVFHFLPFLYACAFLPSVKKDEGSASPAS